MPNCIYVKTGVVPVLKFRCRSSTAVQTC